MPRYRLFVAMLWQIAALALAICAAAAPARAAPPAAAPNHIAAELVAESPAAPGGTVMLAFHMRPAAGWHGYWSNPGDAGFGMNLKWSLPAGVKAGDLRYPVPQPLLISGLMNHVYESDYAVLVPLSLPGTVKPGSILPISVQADWLACTVQICVPERATLTVQITVAAPGSASPANARFDGWRAKLPAPLGSDAHFTVAGDTMRIAIPLPASLPLENPHLFIATDRVVDYPAPQAFFRKGDMLIAELKRTKTLPATPQNLPAVLRLNAAGDGLLIAATPGMVPVGGTPITPTSNAALPESLPLLLLAALLGGLLLNVMPCVFPILSLKALSLARAGESESEARREGLAYSAGVITASAALGGLLLALRAGGSEIGWAFQLQEPGVVAALLLLAVAITANLLGLFEFAIPGFARAGAPQNAFATGLLAAFVATPCTGPFMAAAMGAALLLPVLQAMALFVALGVGIALPFLAIAFIPALRRRLPKPGRWMVSFRRWMALPMGLTALALFWLASRLGGWAFALSAGGIALLLIMRLVSIGRAQRRSLPVARLDVVASLALIGMAIALPHYVHDAADREQQRGLLDARPFSEEALASARASGKPVLVWLTADWCLSCKVNESIAIETETTRAAFAKAGVVVLRGDWTRRDPAITRYLTAQGAAGVPLYVWYPASGEPQQLPQVLGPDSLAELARR